MKIFFQKFFIVSTLYLISTISSHNLQSQQCGGSTKYCSDRETCCSTGGGEYGCCPYINATCCDDQIHCCPENKTCNLLDLICLPKFEEISLRFLLSNIMQKIK